MTATLNGVTKKKPAEQSAEQQAATELVRLAQEQGLSLTGPEGLLKLLTKTVIETALGEEMTEHLGFVKHDPGGAGTGNVRNGSRGKSVLTEASGQVEIEVPRDRAGTFEPQIACETRREDSSLSKSLALYPNEFDDPNAPNCSGLVTTTPPQGSTHGSELVYLFDVYGKQAAFDAGQRELAAEMVQHWTTFAATGRPAPAAIPAMPRYSPSTDQFLSLRPGGNQVITNYASDRQCALWDPIG